jgi:hypothetical protein
VPARLYRPAAPLGAAQLAGALIFAAVIALLVGTAAHVVTRATFHVDVLVPLAVGAGCGAALALVAVHLVLSRPWLMAALAAVSAAAALAVLLALDYRAARAGRAAEIDEVARTRQGIGLASAEELAAVRAALLRDWTLGRYVRERVGLDDSGAFTGAAPVLGKHGAMALSGLELLLAAAIAGMWAGRAASHPACPCCGRWRAERRLGAAAHGVAGPLVARLLAEDAEGAASLLRPPDTREKTLLTLLACPEGHDGDGGVVRVSDLSWTRHRRLAMRGVEEVEVDGELVARLRDALDAEEVPA